MKKLLYLLSLAVVCAACCPPALAQTSGNAQLNGAVTDSSGAVVPDAQITVTNTQTGVMRKTLSNASGNYSVPLLPVGVYDIRGEKTGYAAARVTGLTLNIGDSGRADLTLTVGSVSAEVTVTSNTSQVDMENAEVSQVVSERSVSQLPLNGRDFTELMVTDASAYVTSNSPIASFRPTQGLQVGVGGGRVTSNGYMVDGMNNRDYAFAAPLLLPSIDAIQEFKVDSKTYSAEYGGTSNQVNIHFKSGTNELHGSVYDFLRNSALDAKNYFDSPSTKKARLEQNQFGYSLGGPIYIPKLYNGKNKSFFFANYDGTRRSQASAASYGLLPPAAQLGGQFTSTIIDPTTGLAFPNNQIPSSRISAFAKEELKFAVTPNTTTAGYNFFGNVSLPSTIDQQNYKFDQNFGSHDSVFFRYSYSPTETGNGGFNASGVYGSSNSVTNIRQYQASYTHTFSPSIVNQVTFGFSKAQFNTYAPSISMTDYTAFGVQGGLPDVTNPEIPEVDFLGTAFSSMGSSNNWPFIDSTNYWTEADTLSIIKGRHTINVGFSLLNWSRTNGRGANLGHWQFSGQATGNTVADFLLGYPAIVFVNVPTPLAPTASKALFVFPQYTYAPYVEDSWQVSHRLTISSGMRYEFYQQAREKDNAYFWFDSSAPGGVECTASQAAINDGAGSSLLKYCGANPGPSPKLPFAPRVSAAFLPTKSDNTVVRAGFGLFFDGFEEQDEINAATHYPFIGSETLTAVPGVNLISASTPLPSITKIGPATGSEVGGWTFAPNPKKNPYVEQWTLSVERAIGSKTTLDVSYQGSAAKHLPSRTDINQPSYYNPANPMSVAARRPFQNFADVYDLECEFFSKYNAASVKLQHASKTFVMTAAYTFSKSMDDRSGTFGVGADINGWAAPMDSKNFVRDYGLSSFDLHHRAVVSFVSLIPVGRGQRLLPNMNRAADTFIGGWQFNGIVTAQSGFPFSIAGDDVGGLLDSYVQRANFVGNPYPSGFNKSIKQWFSPSAFAQPASGVYGNSRRNILRAPDYVNFDLSLSKNFNIVEGKQLQFRCESFNAFNHAQFAYPQDDVNSPAFGQITNTASGLGRVLQVALKAVF
jgi:hypothetical protein